MSFHVNPPCISDTGLVNIEAMVIYGEHTDFFKYIRSLIPDWEYYVSKTVTLDADAEVTLQANDQKQQHTGKCKAYIYGWEPGSVEWVEGSCVAIVFFDMPKLTVPSTPLTVTVTVKVTSDDELIFYNRRTVPVTTICQT